MSLADDEQTTLKKDIKEVEKKQAALTKELKETNDKILAKANDANKTQLENLVANKKKIMAAVAKANVKQKKL